MKEHKVYLALGSNLGDKKANIERAIRLIEELIGRVDRQSALIVTEPWGFRSDNNFVNAAIRCLTTLSPRQLLTATQSIELSMGRKAKTVAEQYEDRIIDIDILLYDDITINEPGLKIPHPLMHERDFVMRPLNEILDDRN